MDCVQGIHFPDHAFLLNTTGNDACRFQCEPGYLLSVSRLYCVEFNATLPSFSFSAYVEVPDGGLAGADVELYTSALADALGVARTAVFATLSDDTLSVVVQCADHQVAAGLAQTTKTDAFQRALNTRFMYDPVLSVPVIDQATVTTSFEVTPPPSPSPVSPSPSPVSPSPSPPTAVVAQPPAPKSSASRACRAPSAVILWLCLALAQKILGDNP